MKNHLKSKNAFIKPSLIFVFIVLGILAFMSVVRQASTDLHTALHNIATYHTANDKFSSIKNMTNANLSGNLDENAILKVSNKSCILMQLVSSFNHKDYVLLSKAIDQNTLHCQVLYQMPSIKKFFTGGKIDDKNYDKNHAVISISNLNVKFNK